MLPPFQGPEERGGETIWGRGVSLLSRERWATKSYTDWRHVPAEPGGCLLPTVRTRNTAYSLVSALVPVCSLQGP